ncbi:hypothetical protein ACFLYU_05565 [Candidatus Dependentiae bacterium]
MIRKTKLIRCAIIATTVIVLTQVNSTLGMNYNKEAKSVLNLDSLGTSVKLDQLNHTNAHINRIKSISKKYNFTCLELKNKSHIILKNNKLYRKNIVSYNFLENGALLLVKYSSNKVELTNLKNDKAILEFKDVCELQLLLCDQFLFVKFRDSSVKLITLETYKTALERKNINYIKKLYMRILTFKYHDGPDEMINLENFKSIRKLKDIMFYTKLGNNKLIVEYNNSTGGLINLENNKTIRTFKAFKSHKIVNRKKNNKKILVEYGNNMAELINLENDKTIRKFEQFSDYKLNRLSDTRLSYYWQINYLLNSKKKELLYLGNSKSYIFDTITALKKFPLLLLILNDKSLVLINLSDNTNKEPKEFKNIDSFRFSCQKSKNPCKPLWKIPVSHSKESKKHYLMVKYKDASAKLINLENYKTVKSFKDVDSFTFLHKEHMLLVKYNDKSPELINLDNTKNIDIKLNKNTQYCGYSPKKTFLWARLRDKHDDIGFELINIKTKSRIKLQDLDENGIKRLKDEKLLWINSHNGEKKIIETQNFNTIRAFKNKENATLKKNFLHYIKKDNTHKIIELVEITKALELVKKKSKKKIE